MKHIGKVFLGILVLVLLVGCGNMKLTPTKKVEDLLSKYTSKDKGVMDQLELTINEAGTMTDTQKENYRKLMENQYENLTYKIKEERIDGTNATVAVEIEVYDYGKAISASEDYLTTHKEEFLDTETNAIDPTKFLDYKIKGMQDVKDKIKYTVNFTLTDKDNEWLIDDLSDTDRLKIHGLYY